MRRHAVLGSCAAAAILLTSCTQDRPTGLSPSDLGSGPSLSEASSAGEKIPGQYIVRLRDDVQDVAGIAVQIAQANGGTVGYVYTHAIKGFSIKIADAAAAAIAQHSRVLYVEQDQVVRVITDQLGATWGISRIDQRDLPAGSVYVYNSTGLGVTAYIIDTGIRKTHNEFDGQYGTNRAVHGINTVGDKPATDSEDCNGHGTHVAGTVGGDLYGVAKAVTLVAVRVLDCGGSGSNSGVIAGVDWVTVNADLPAVANMSLGGGFSQALNDAVKNSGSVGVTYAVAAGNGYSNACDGSPASELSAITVGATDINDREAAFSDRGSCLDGWAPGVGITSAGISSDVATATFDGTSMAAPHVAGAAALYLEKHSAHTPAQVDQALSDNATTGKITWTDFFGAKPAPPPAGQDYLLYTGFISGDPDLPPALPAAPTNLTAAAVTSTRIDLFWTDNANNPDNEANFEIERCVGAGCTNFARVGRAGGDATTYQDRGVSVGTTYEYRIRASNVGGTSAYSNGAQAQTPDNSPVARYTWSCAKGGGGRTCTFNGSGSTDDKGIASHSWNFGDGSSGSGASVTKTYSSRGTYTVTLMVRDQTSPVNPEGQSNSRSCAVTTPSSGSCQ
jgi:subtilisin family serine protease